MLVVDRDAREARARRPRRPRRRRRRQRRGATGVELGRRVWVATWPKLAAVALALGVWQVVVWTGWRPEYVLPGPGHGVRPARRADRRRHRARCPRRHDAPGGRRVRPRPRHRRRHRRRRGVVADRPVGGRLDDHRPADDAVDRLVPAGHPAVPAVRGGDHVRRRARRGAVDRQRADRRRRPRAADPAARRSGDGRHRVRPLPPRRAAGVAAVVRRRPEAGLGVRLAQPDGRRAARHARRVLGRLPAPAVPQPSTTRRR